MQHTNLDRKTSLLVMNAELENGYFLSSAHSPHFGPRPSALAPGLIYFFTAPSPNYFFTAPNDGITLSWLPTSKITFSWPLVITIVCHVFLYSFKQNSTYRLFKNSFQQNVLSYTNQLQCESIGCFFIRCKLKVIFK